MTKAELIERHGVEWYEAYKAKKREYMNNRYNNDAKVREAKKYKYRYRYHNDLKWCEYYKAKSREYMNRLYHNDSEYREREIAYRTARTQHSYCKEGEFELIENYELAKNDNFKGWHIHHRLEIHDDYINSMDDLIMMNLYYNRPPEELIFLTKSEHMKLHRRSNK